MRASAAYLGSGDCRFAYRTVTNHGSAFKACDELDDKSGAATLVRGWRCRRQAQPTHRWRCTTGASLLAPRGPHRDHGAPRAPRRVTPRHAAPRQAAPLAPRRVRPRRWRRAASRSEVVEARPSAEPWSPFGVDMSGWEEPDLSSGSSAFDADFPSVVVNAMVTGLAEQNTVLEICRSSVSHPPENVMGAGHARGKSAHRASAVAFDEGESLGFREQPLLTSPVEDLSRRIEDAGDDAAAGRHPARGGDAHRLTHAVDQRMPVAAFEILQAHPHDDGRSGERDVVVLASEHMARDEHQRIQLTLGTDRMSESGSVGRCGSS